MQVQRGSEETTQEMEATGKLMLVGAPAWRQPVRPPACHAGGRGSKSRRSRQFLFAERSLSEESTAKEVQGAKRGEDS
jgi:hypothetical protein